MIIANLENWNLEEKVEKKTYWNYCKYCLRKVFRLKKTVYTRWQSLEEVTWQRRQLASKLWVSQIVKPTSQRYCFERHCVKDHGCSQAEQDEQARSPRVSPAQKRLNSLPLSCYISNHGLNPTRNTSEPVIPQPDHVLWPRRWKRVKLFIKLIRINSLGPRELHIHVRRVSRPWLEVPQSDKEHVQKHRGHDKLRVHDQNEEQDMDQNRSNRVSPVADILKPLPDQEIAGEKRHYAEKVGFASSHAP